MSLGDLSRPCPSRGLQRALRTLLLGALAAVAALAVGSSAAAQDETTNSLQSIDPPNGATLDQSPAAIVLSFNQELRSDDRPIVVLACGTPSQPQDTGSPEVDGDGLIVTIPINTPVPRGACTVSWRLADAAGETIVGDFTTFRVDADPAPVSTPPPTQAIGATTTTSPFISITPNQNTSSSTTPNQGSNGGALWLGRMLSTLGILALFGGLALIAIGWPEGPEYVVTVRYLRAVWILALVGTVLYLIAYAAKYNDISFGAAMNPSDWLDLKDDGWPGRAALLRLAFVLGSGWVAMRPERIIDPATAMWAWAIPGGALVTIALSRVAGPAPWLGVAIGVFHVLGSAIWFGGVALVARVVLAGPGEEDLLHATRAYSRISTKAMVLTIATGVAQMIRLDGNPFGSSHGRVVLLKVVAVAAMLAVGLEARRQVGYRLDRAHEMTVPLADRFRRAFGAEAAIGVVVLAFSGWLLSLTPPKVDKFANEEYNRTIAFIDPSTGIDARVFIGPAQVGRNGFRIEVEAPQEGITTLGLRFYPPVESGQDVIFQPLNLSTAGTLVLPTENGIPFGVAGNWTIELSASTGLGTNSSQTTFVVSGADGSQESTPQGTNPSVPVGVTVVDQPTTTAPFVTTAPPTPPPSTSAP